MNKKEFGALIQTIKGCYGERFQKLDADMMEAWYDCLNDLDYEKTRVALRNYIKVSVYPPTIADIRKHYEEIMEEEKNIRIELRRIYDMTVALYPCANCEPDVESVYKSIIGKYEEHMRLDIARKILHKSASYVKERELSTEGTIIPLTEFLRKGDWK